MITRKDYAITQGYEFNRPFEWPGLDPTGFDFRFIVFGLGGSDRVLTVGDGITFDGVLPNWTIALDTTDLVLGSYQYSHDYKGASGGWKQISAGEFRVVDPRTMP